MAAILSRGRWVNHCDSKQFIIKQQLINKAQPSTNAADDEGMHSASQEFSTWFRWLSAKLQYLQCVSNGDTAVLH